MRIQSSVRLLVLLVLLVSLVSCGGKKAVNYDKTLVQAGGTHIISNVQSILPRIGSGGDDDFVDMSSMTKEEVQGWIEQNPGATVETAIFFDDFKLGLDSQPVNSYGEFSGLKKNLDKRMNEINNFLKGDKRQLDVKNW